MSRLPTPGLDSGTWGDILNDFLAQAHNSDGTLKSGAVDADSLASGSGTDGQVLTKDSVQSGGIKWAAVPSAPVTSVNGQTGVVVLTKSDVSLGDVDNTADANKPVSSATQTALDAKTNKSVLTAKGDLYAASAASTPSRVGVGSDGQVLMADSAQTTGLKWAVASDAQLKGSAVYVEDYGAVGDGTTDDTTAIRNAINAAVATAVSSASNYAEVRFQAKTYVVNGSLAQGGTTFGNAIIPVPIISMTANCVTLQLKGAGPASALPIWTQATGQYNGTVLKTTISGTNSGTYGPACVIGGPNSLQGYGTAGNTWNNMLIVVDGISILAPMNPSISGFDFQGMAQAIVKSASFLVNNGITTIARSTSNWQFGLRMPTTNNQSQQIVEQFTVEGCCYGLYLGEHSIVHELYSFYNLVAIQCVTSASMPHATVILYANCEGDSYVLQSDSGSNFKIHCYCLDYENVSGYGTSKIISDVGNRLKGEVRFSYPSNGGNSPIAFGSSLLEGGSYVRIIDMERIPGQVTAPSVPATTTTLRNTFWRDAVVQVNGADLAAVKVDGQTVLTAASGGMVVVPSGKTIELDYTTAPTWIWTLL